jgi:hypothetical protein
MEFLEYWVNPSWFGLKTVGSKKFAKVRVPAICSVCGAKVELKAKGDPNERSTLAHAACDCLKDWVAFWNHSKQWNTQCPQCGEFHL